ILTRGNKTPAASVAAPGSGSGTGTASIPTTTTTALTPAVPAATVDAASPTPTPTPTPTPVARVDARPRAPTLTTSARGPVDASPPGPPIDPELEPFDPNDQRLTATVHIDSDPADADVSIDGVASCLSPCERELTVGSHTITIKLAGYRTVDSRVEVE